MPAPQRISRRLASVSEAVTVAVDARANELLAAGELVLTFGVGDTDLPTPSHVVAAAAAACADPASHRYTATAGLPVLRRAVARKTYRDSGLEVDDDQVLITNGSKHAINAAFTAVLDPLDEVLLPAPYWTTYPESIRLVGGVPVPVPAERCREFRVTVDQLECARTERTKALVFVSPANPTGTVYPRDDVEAIGRWAAAHGLWVLADEVYGRLVFDGAEAVSMPVVVPELRDRCMVVSGVSKTYAMTGWRVGWLIGPLDVIAAATSYQSHVTSNVNNVAQAAALAALTGDDAPSAQIRDIVDRRRRLMVALLQRVEGMECALPQGGLYVFPSVTGLLSRALVGRPLQSSLEVAEVLLTEARVAVVPGEAFGAPGYVRMTCARSEAEIREGVGRMQRLFSQVRP
jgi:aspartate aminotransferase